MALTAEQRATLKTYIQSVPELNALYVEGSMGPLADALNLPSADKYVWRTDVPKREIFTAITWKNYLPVDTPDVTTIWTNRSLACQGQHDVLQTLLIAGGDLLDMSDTQIKQGMQDVLQNIPSGAGGALRDAGWSAVKSLSTRLATVLEAVFASGNGTQGNPAKLVVMGNINWTELLEL